VSPTKSRFQLPWFHCMVLPCLGFPIHAMGIAELEEPREPAQWAPDNRVGDGLHPRGSLV
jgi:hypothetical protein